MDEFQEALQEALWEIIADELPMSLNIDLFEEDDD